MSYYKMYVSYAQVQESLNDAFGDTYLNYRHEQSQTELHRGHYAYIPSSRVIFINAVLRLGFDRFIDAGSGIGDKTFLAWKYTGKECFGIEYNKESFRASKALIGGNRGITLINGDATRHDYHRYDLIWTFRPMHDTRKIWDRILDTMPIGGRLVEYMGEFLLMHAEDRHILINEHRLHGGIGVITRNSAHDYVYTNMPFERYGHEFEEVRFK